MALATLSWLAVHGCADVNGGAVEVSWDLRRDDGADLDCEDANVKQIQLYWSAAGEARHNAFPCEDARGVTGFQIEAGEVELWLQPVCAGGDAIAGFRAPPPIVRTITEGEVITLTTQIIDVKVTGCTDQEPCVCP